VQPNKEVGGNKGLSSKLILLKV
ncbi:hypothetical protein CCACVL1_22439, partial [Corchorus capsularis]